MAVKSDEGWRPDEPWWPEGWRISDSWWPETWLTTREICLSGDRAFVYCGDMPRTGIGVGFVLSLADGAIEYTTRHGPIHDVAAFPNGRFLVGYGGYSDFDTLLYGRDGAIEARWPTHGGYVVGDADDVRVIEIENSLPSTSHVVRLRDHGEVEKGAHLEGYYTSKLHVRRDGAILFVRNGALACVRDIHTDSTCPIPGCDEKTYARPFVGSDSGLAFVAWAIHSTDTSTVMRAEV